MIGHETLVEELTKTPFLDLPPYLCSEDLCSEDLCSEGSGGLGSVRAVRIRGPEEYVLYNCDTQQYKVSVELGGLLISFFKRFVSDNRLWQSDKVPGQRLSRRRNPKITMWKELQRLITRPEAYDFLPPAEGESANQIGRGMGQGMGQGMRLQSDGVTLLRTSPIPDIVPKIYLSGAEFAQDPHTGPDQWRDLEIGCIINTTEDNPADSYLIEVYQDMNIKYLSVPISDSSKIPPPEYLQAIVQAVRELPLNSGNILVHCTAGINRSAYVAAALLWYTTPNARQYWPNAEALIEYMRQRQIQDRNQVMLFNRAFCDDLTQKLRH